MRLPHSQRPRKAAQEKWKNKQMEKAFNKKNAIVAKVINKIRETAPAIFKVADADLKIDKTGNIHILQILGNGAVLAQVQDPDVLKGLDRLLLMLQNGMTPTVETVQDGAVLVQTFGFKE